MESMRAALILVSLWALLSSGPRLAAAPPASVVVELFTSEGCSSCPPADRLLAELVRTQPVPAARVIAMSEHVDYWDNLGWKDPFSSASFTRRQNAYAATSGQGDVYTPQIVVNGTETVVGSNREAVLAAIRRAAAKPAAPVSIELGWKDSGNVETTIAAHSGGRGDLVVLAITEDGLASSVKSGENAGRTIDHVGVTRRLIRLGALKTDGSFHDARQIEFDAAWRSAQLHLIALIQRGDSGAIVASQTSPANPIRIERRAAIGHQ